MYNTKPTLGMLNDEKKVLTFISQENVFIQIEFWTLKTDHQFNYLLLKFFFEYQVDEDGKYTGKKDTYCLSGFVRAKGHAD